MGEPPPPPSPSPSPSASAPAKVYYEGCPGCAMDRKKETRKGVPYKELLFVGITTFASGTCTRVVVCHPATNVHAEMLLRHASSSTVLVFLNRSIVSTDVCMVLFYCMRATPSCWIWIGYPLLLLSSSLLFFFIARWTFNSFSTGRAAQLCTVDCR